MPEPINWPEDMPPSHLTPARRTVRCGTCRGYYAEGELHTCPPKPQPGGGEDR